MLKKLSNPVNRADGKQRELAASTEKMVVVTKMLTQVGQEPNLRRDGTDEEIYVHGKDLCDKLLAESSKLDSSRTATHPRRGR